VNGSEIAVIVAITMCVIIAVWAARRRR